MDLMFTGLPMALGIAVMIVIGVFLTTAVARVAGDMLNREPLHSDAEKPKRDHLILSEDGELLEIADSEREVDEKPKRGYQA